MKNRNRIPKIGSWLAVALVIVVSTAGGARFDAGPPVEGAGLEAGAPAEEVLITVREITNLVQSQLARDQDAASTEFVRAMVGQELLPGDGIKTFQNSEARVDILVGGFTRINRTTPNTIWRVGKFAVEGRTIIELDQGTVFLFDDAPEKEGWPVDIVTPTGRASPRGTWMAVEYDPNTGVTEVQCFRGSCQLQNLHGTTVLGAEQKSALSATTAPSMPEVLEVADQRGFTELPEAASGEVPIPPALKERPAVSHFRPPPGPVTQEAGEPIGRFSSQGPDNGGEMRAGAKASGAASDGIGQTGDRPASARISRETDDVNGESAPTNKRNPDDGSESGGDDQNGGAAAAGIATVAIGLMASGAGAAGVATVAIGIRWQRWRRRQSRLRRPGPHQQSQLQGQPEIPGREIQWLDGGDDASEGPSRDDVLREWREERDRQIREPGPGRQRQ